VLYAAAKLVSKQIKYTRLTDQYSVPTIKKAFHLLQQAQIIHKISAVSPAGLPLEASASEKKFKAILLDIGLMQQICGLPIDSDYFTSDILAVYQGAMAEQFVGQQLIAARNENIFYWSREAKSSTAEVDFIFSKDGNIYPVEVKSGLSGKLRSLHLLLNEYPNLKSGYVFSDAPYGEITDQKLIFLPVYYAYHAGRN
jgi:predicted AAA+ superfamily ATPase